MEIIVKKREGEKGAIALSIFIDDNGKQSASYHEVRGDEYKRTCKTIANTVYSVLIHSEPEQKSGA
jgi:hypothetical protein